MDNSPKATIAVCSVVSCDSTRSLGSVLSALCGQEGIEYFQIILVLDNANDSIHKIIPNRLRNQVVVSLSPVRRGIAVARETAIQLAVGKYILFTDDDCLPRNDWAKELVRHMECDNHLVAAGGLTLPFRTQTIVESYIDFEKAQRKPLTNKNGKIVCISTVNAIFNLIALRRIEFLSKAYHAIYSYGEFPGFEDFDLSYRMSKEYGDTSLGYCDTAIVYHKNRDTVMSRLQQYRYYGFGASFWALANDFAMDKYQIGYRLPRKASWMRILTLVVKGSSHHIQKFLLYKNHFSLSVSITFSLIGFLENLFFYLGAREMYSIFNGLRKRGLI
jgi:glycosyltransferase involved in cell wall biosynthesis